MTSALDRRAVVVAIAIATAAVAISLTGSGNPSLWGDEAASVLSAQRSLPSLGKMVQNVDAVHALYYVALHLWVDVFGSSPFSVRVPSAIAVGLACAAIVATGALLRGIRYGAIAGIIAAVLPRMTDIGSEARSFAMTAAIASWLTLTFVLIIRAHGRRKRLWFGYGALLALGTSLFIWLALVAVAHLVCLLIARERARGAGNGLVVGWLVSSVAAAVVAAPVLILALVERRQIAYLADRQRYDIDSLLVSPWFENPFLAGVGWAMIAVAVAMVVREGAARSGRDRVETLLPLAWLAVPPLALLIASIGIAVYTPRYLAMSAPAVALMVAVGIDALMASKRRVEAVTAIAAVIALAAPVWASQRGPYAKNDSDWAAISEYVGDRARPGDAVAFDDETRPSRRPRLALRTYPAGFAGLADPTLKTPYWQNSTWYDDTYALDEALALGRLDGVSRVWLIEYAISGVADTYGIDALKGAGFELVSTTGTHRSSILEFVRS